MHHAWRPTQKTPRSSDVDTSTAGLLASGQTFGEHFCLFDPHQGEIMAAEGRHAHQTFGTALFLDPPKQALTLPPPTPCRSMT